MLFREEFREIKLYSLYPNYNKIEVFEAELKIFLLKTNQYTNIENNCVKLIHLLNNIDEIKIPKLKSNILKNLEKLTYKTLKKKMFGLFLSKKEFNKSIKQVISIINKELLDIEINDAFKLNHLNEDILIKIKNFCLRIEQELKNISFSSVGKRQIDVVFLKNIFASIKKNIFEKTPPEFDKIDLKTIDTYKIIKNNIKDFLKKNKIIYTEDDISYFLNLFSNSKLYEYSPNKEELLFLIIMLAGNSITTKKKIEDCLFNNGIVHISNSQSRAYSNLMTAFKRDNIILFKNNIEFKINPLAFFKIIIEILYKTSIKYQHIFEIEKEKEIYYKLFFGNNENTKSDNIISTNIFNSLKDLATLEESFKQGTLNIKKANHILNKASKNYNLNKEKITIKKNNLKKIKKTGINKSNNDIVFERFMKTIHMRYSYQIQESDYHFKLEKFTNEILNTNSIFLINIIKGFQLYCEELYFSNYMRKITKEDKDYFYFYNIVKEFLSYINLNSYDDNNKIVSIINNNIFFKILEDYFYFENISPIKINNKKLISNEMKEYFQWQEL